jgi:hypothetical protein
MLTVTNLETLKFLKKKALRYDLSIFTGGRATIDIQDIPIYRGNS